MRSTYGSATSAVCFEKSWLDGWQQLLLLRLSFPLGEIRSWYHPKLRCIPRKSPCFLIIRDAEGEAGARAVGVRKTTEDDLAARHKVKEVKEAGVRTPRQTVGTPARGIPLAGGVFGFNLGDAGHDFVIGRPDAHLVTGR